MWLEGSMRNMLMGFFALFLFGCSSKSPTENDGRLTVAPPTLSVAATSRPVSNVGGGQDLEVSAVLRNSTKSHILLVNGAQCPLFVRLFPDPKGESSGSLDPSMGCPSGGPTIDLAPGDTRLLTHTLPAAALASFAPGQYGINVAVTTTTDLMGTWGGTVLLPLGTSR
jgi:hypothetical protein